MLWGHQAQGLPPSRVRDLRRAVALQVGLQKLGDLEVALSAEADRVSDPWATVVMQQVQEWFTALSRWGPEQAPLDRVWQQTATGFSEGTANWHHVKGPLAATVGHMTGLGWSLPGVMEWHRPEPRTVYNLEVAAERARVLQAIEEDVCAERFAPVAKNRPLGSMSFCTANGGTNLAGSCQAGSKQDSVMEMPGFGPYTKDPRLRKVGVSVVAFEWKQGELYGILLLLQGTVGTADATVDCLGVVRRLAQCKGKAHADLWAAIKAEKHSRLEATWVASHLTPMQFVSRFGEDQAWRQVTNEVADEACSSFAGSLVDAGLAARMHELDTVHRKVLDVLSARAAKILGAKKLAAHPCVKAYLELKEAQAAKKPAQAETVADKKDSNTSQKKHRAVGTNVGHGHTQTYQEWFEQLTQ
ncbi:unnamed protein product, partial [Symbiodinium microadriaticum]